MELSIIIVNYNVKAFLEQCLNSVLKAIEGIDAEVFVVDNNSVDGSCAMVRDGYPGVTLIENRENRGFSKANNQALALARGRYVLLLNPDTVVQETTFDKVLSFMDATPRAGGLGVKMIDGRGRFLPESKRAFPSPWVAFCKIFGLSALFPASRYCNAYHLGYLHQEQIHEVDVLSGAFMLIRKSVLDEIGYLDESFFMYGEDIDLSYRIVKAGHKNYYFPLTTILHYKGQSTQKSSMNYVFVFYGAMKIFAKKHLSRNNARWYILLINIAIYMKASLVVAGRCCRGIFYPACDSALIYAGFALITPYWASYRFNDPGYDFPGLYYSCNVPAYALVWVVALFLTGAYQKPISLGKTNKALFAGAIINFLILALLPEEYRFSRAMMILGSAWTFIVLVAYRKILSCTNLADFKIKAPSRNLAIVVGSEEECARVSSLVAESEPAMKILGYVSVNQEPGSSYLGSLAQISEVAEINGVDEIIFCERDIPETVIISTMMIPSLARLEFKIALRHSLFIIGSNMIGATLSQYAIASPRNTTVKRALDVALASVFLLLVPVFLLVSRRSGRFARNCVDVCSGRKTFVGYNPCVKSLEIGLPPLKESLVSVAPGGVADEETIEKINVTYARNYSPFKDISRIFTDFHELSD